MAYKVEFKPKAIEEISDIERVVAQRILEKTKWLSENVRRNNATTSDR